MKISKLGIILRGAAMGVAEIIPGVSGGTIAFISGIYKTLLDSVSAVNISFFKALLKGDFSQAFAKINGGFLTALFAGMAFGVVIAVFGVSYLLENYPEPLWAFFFGLILASIPLMFRQLSKISMQVILFFIVGVIIAYGITSLNPVEASDNFLYIYFAGAIAICALVLPGISGSFILLLLGLYSVIIPTLKSFLKAPELDSFIVLAVFGLGCLTGLAFISRLVTKAFEKFNNQTLAILSGFMLGSLNKIWPWRNVSEFLEKDTGNRLIANPEIILLQQSNPDNFKVLSEVNVMPEAYHSDPNIALVALGFLLGIITISALAYFQIRAERKQIAE